MISIAEEIKAAAKLFNHENFRSFYQQMIKEFHALLGEIKDGAYDCSGLTGGHEVEDAYAITGAFDIYLRIRIENVEKLNEFLVKLRKIIGIERTQTGIILAEA